MQRAHDHFERGLVLEFRMRVDRNTSAVVGHRDEAIRRHFDFDPIGVAGERFVHRVVDHLGKQVVERLLVGTSDVHARPAADRLEPLKHFDVFRRIAGIAAGRAAGGAASSAAAVAPRLRGVGKQVGHFRRFGGLGHGYSQLNSDVERCP